MDNRCEETPAHLQKMGSKLDTTMNRAMAMVVDLSTPEMIERAKELEKQYPESCWVSDVSTKRDRDHKPVFSPTLYYLWRENIICWINEEWIRTGVGSPLT